MLSYSSSARLLLGPLAERPRQLTVVVEVVLDRGLAAPGDEGDALDAGIADSSTTYWTIGFLPTGSISLGCDLVAGAGVPNPATGTTALRIAKWIPLQLSSAV